MLIRRSSVCCYKMSFAYVLGELQELIVEVRKGDWGLAWGEFLDVYSCLMVWLSDVSGLDLVLLENKSTRSWQRRWAWWQRWLQAHGLKFRPELMRQGANFRRREKRAWVLEQARKQ